MEWRTVPGWPAYEVSDAGDVRRVKPSHNFGCLVLSASQNDRGYRSVTLFRDGTRRTVPVQRLVALAFVGPAPSSDYDATFKDGNASNVRADNIEWATKREICLKRERRRPPRAANVIGSRFGLLLVLEEADPEARSYAYRPLHNTRRVRCRCDCGTVTIVALGNLRRGATTSCGCVRAEMLGERSFRHGDAVGYERTVEYSTWKGMKDRCGNPRNKHFKYYGGRGIQVCDEWRDNFAAFLAHVGRRPSRKHSIDRINVDGHYEPGNVRWATAREQRLNQRPRRRATPPGVGAAA